MGNISGSINLAAFRKAFYEERTNSNGEKVPCITIPLPANWTKKDEKGAIWVNIHGRWLSPEQRKGKSTHILGLDPGKEIREKLKETDEKYPPTLGNLINWDETEAPGESAATPQDSGFTPAPSDPTPF